MDVYWLGDNPVLQDLGIRRVESLDETPENCLVFIDRPQQAHAKDIASRRIYLVDNGQESAGVPEGVMGVIPGDISVIKAMALLYTEMSESFEIGDHLIRSIGEKDRAIQEKQQQLIRDSRRHNAIIKHANDLIFILGPTGKIMFCNETFRHYLGGKENQAARGSFIDHVLEDDHASLTQMITKGYARGVPARCEVRLHLLNGRIGIFSLLSTPLVEEGHIYALSVIGRDISDLRAMQHRLSLQANDLSRMIDGLSHELRNPLTVIGAYIRRLERDGEKKTRKWEQALSGIYSSIQRIEDMIERIERYEALVRMEHSFREVDICGLVRQTLSTVACPVPVHVSSPGKVSAFCDPEHVRVAFLRIFENAVETGTEKIHVEIACSGGYVLIGVRDYGPGVRDDMETIFAPFYSTDPMKTGLGLTEARIAMAKVGGDISVVPQANPGARFTLTILQDRR
ncbi:MAG TPA: PAS domain-containing sensor histidine kinase, partial [Deltaproteobacteria bacterium]|nr:PAS domain-containing sensor histidine kinase [Deltaproteobacteria bacterium]